MEITIKGQTVILSDKAADYISRLGRGMRNEVVGAMGALGLHDEAMAWKIASDAKTQMVNEAESLRPTDGTTEEIFWWQRPAEPINSQIEHVNKLWQPIEDVIRQCSYQRSL